ncbi:MAG: dienelactone hydrolase family protein [Anaerolinea sp.]|nr:dienelactone hydrolase family protein [Anaerolinea sp.]
MSEPPRALRGTNDRRRRRASRCTNLACESPLPSGKTGQIPMHARLPFFMNIPTLLARILTPLLLAATWPAAAADFIAPPTGAGPAVVVISGTGNQAPYRWYAVDVARLGYAVALVPGKDVCSASSSSCSKTDAESAENLQKAITELQGQKDVTPGKVVVISFSLGGGGALVHAAPISKQVAGVVAYYPSISKITRLDDVAARVAVPTLILSGEKDKFFDCCLIDSMRTFESTGRAKGAPIELVVYPNADHGFNFDGSRYRPDDGADAWERTKVFLARVLPLPLK